MKSFDEIKELAIQTLQIEADAVTNLQANIDNNFAKIVELIYSSSGRVVVTGIGKSAIIAQKIVATFNSTGTPAIYMHAADAIHGDLGNIQSDDVVVCISKSGNTPEIKALIPLIRNMGNKIIGMVGNTESVLSKNAHFVINSTVEKEACPNNLAPTSSTTAQLAMGDALAVCLLQYRDFNSEDFAQYHPGGTLGKKLNLRVVDLSASNEKPMVFPTTNIKDVIVEISSKRLGATAVVDKEAIVGTITDGDIRRMLEQGGDLNSLCARDIMGKNPKTIDKQELAVSALNIMKSNNITQLLVTENDVYFGVIHLHDLIKEGII